MEKGTIFKAMRSAYIDYTGGAWCDHFVKKPVLFQALETPSNNGNFRARDARNHLFWFNELEVMEIVK